MKPDEIKKALECCTGKGCLGCPYYCANATCLNKMFKDILAYINEFEAANERLNNKVEELSEVLSDSIKIKAKEIKSDAIKEFAERLKEAKANSTMDSRICTTEMIDNLVKEMVGESNA